MGDTVGLSAFMWVASNASERRLGSKYQLQFEYMTIRCFACEVRLIPIVRKTRTPCT
jgi:hypothetical protein